MSGVTVLRPNSGWEAGLRPQNTRLVQSRSGNYSYQSWDDNGGATPVPIPNTEVKPVRADGTAWAAVWESRSLPGFISNSNKG